MKITKLSEFLEFTGDLIRMSVKFEIEPKTITVKITPEIVNMVKPHIGNGISATLFDGEKKFEYQGMTFTW